MNFNSMPDPHLFKLFMPVMDCVHVSITRIPPLRPQEDSTAILATNDDQ